MGFKQWLGEMAFDLSNFDEPLDKELKSTLGKRKILLYHGSSTTHFWNIVQNGFGVKPEVRNWKSSDGVFFAFTPGRAAIYTVAATRVAGGDGILFVVELPHSWLEVDKDDAEKFDRDTKLQTMTFKEVPAKYITGVIYPCEEPFQEIPIKKFITDVNKGKYPTIPPKYAPTTRFQRATPDELESLIFDRYLVNLLQYTSLAQDQFDNEGYYRRVITQALSKLLPTHTWQNWKGRDWIVWLEKVLGDKNSEDYYDDSPEFQVPIWKYLNKYRSDAMQSYNKFRLGKKVR